MEPTIYISRAAAERWATRAVRKGEATEYWVEPRRRFNGDRTLDLGFVAIVARPDGQRAVL